MREEGIVATSARAIAKRGDFNQALIFYHFGSVTDLLVAAAVEESRERAERYAPRLAEVHTLPELVAVARDLHEQEMAEGGLAVLTQLLAGSASSPELRKGILDAFGAWMGHVDAAVARTLEGTAYASLVSTADMSHAISALFFGIELLHNLDPDSDRAQIALRHLRGGCHPARSVDPPELQASSGPTAICETWISSVPP